MAANVFSPNGVDFGRRLVAAAGPRTGGAKDYVAAEARKAGLGYGGALS